MSSEKMKTAEAAQYISKSTGWLNKSRMNGSGPVYLKIGGAVRYLRTDLDAWLDSKRRTAIYDFANDNRRAQAAAS
ncbi:helix-turn-helix transcriptional regulator [Ciceribacter selenitireducens]|uniref:helix-turn-helix transcriptional regulator n=1 Tax=Ciceribacter selenitireducens TaxID=448181 RepID=UPI000E204CB4|nr:helix-turn-helix domain-containing protein [Ciceribacter selenitireducens]